MRQWTTVSKGTSQLLMKKLPSLTAFSTFHWCSYLLLETLWCLPPSWGILPFARRQWLCFAAFIAISDLLIGILAQPLFIADELTSLRSEDPMLHRITAMAGFFVCGVSLGTMTFISVDRFMALHYHLRYSILVTKPRVVYALGTIWLFIFLWLAIYLWNKLFYHSTAGIFTAVCLIISTYSYIRIYRIVRQHQQQIHVQQQAVEHSNIANNRHMMRVKKSAMNTFVFYIFMIICYFPNVVIMTLFGTAQKDWRAEWNFATTIVFLNSSINPVLYCWRLRELRTAIGRISKRLLFKQNEENTISSFSIG